MRNRTSQLIATAVVSCLSSGVAYGHPGHGVGGGSFSLVHYFTEPQHGLGALLGLFALASLIAWSYRR